MKILWKEKVGSLALSKNNNTLLNVICVRPSVFVAVAQHRMLDFARYKQRGLIKLATQEGSTGGGLIKPTTREGSTEVGLIKLATL